MMGLPIAGVKSLSEDRPFRVYNGQTEYAKWLFTYFDLEVQRLPGQGNRPRPGQQQVTPGSTGRPPGRPGSTGNPPNRQP